MPRSIRTHASRPVSSMRTHVVNAVIPNGETITGVIDLEGGARRIHGIVMPAAWTAAELTFLVSVDGVRWLPLRDGTADVEIAAAGGATDDTAFALANHAALAGWPQVVIQSGTHAMPVAQGAERTLEVLTVEWT